ncbi:MAG TPA: trypsin-like peptidase domain-containing protein [Rhizomicrobium sp.]|nr:trypsin-like peptidase domain-containing protein [Rhizomicrobium sp.]
MLFIYRTVLHWAEAALRLRNARTAVAFLFAVSAAALFALSRQDAIGAQDWDGQVRGIAYNPSHVFTKRDAGRIAPERIDGDMAQLSRLTAHIRTFTVANGLDKVPEIASRYGITVSLGIAIGADLDQNEKEIKLGIATALAHQRVVDRVFVGNEAILFSFVTPEQLNAYIERVRTALPARIKITTAEPWSTWMLTPELGKEVDIVSVHLLPYWEGIDVKNSLDFLRRTYGEVQQEFPDKPIVIGEAGWPSEGRDRKAAQASLANEASFTRAFVQLAMEQGYDYYLMEGYDQPLKSTSEGEVGASWGLYDANGTAKFAFGGPVPSTERSGYQRIAAVVLLALCVLTLAWGRSRVSGHTIMRWSAALAIAALAGVLGLAWIGLESERAAGRRPEAAAAQAAFLEVDGKWLVAVAGPDGIARIYRAGKLVGRVRGHGAAIEHVAFVDRGRILISTDASGATQATHVDSLAARDDDGESPVLNRFTAALWRPFGEPLASGSLGLMRATGVQFATLRKSVIDMWRPSGDIDTVSDAAQMAVVHIWTASGSLQPSSPAGTASLTIATGSGFAVSRDGYIVTSYAAVKDAKFIGVLLSGEPEPQSTNDLTALFGKGRTARVLYVSAARDLAVVKVEDRLAASLTLADAPVAKNSAVYAFGYPDTADSPFRAPRADPTVTNGVVGRGYSASLDPGDTRNAVPVIQHNASVNGGSSGGPLLDACGRVVGVNTWSGADATRQGAAGSQTNATVGVYYASAATGLIAFLRANNVPYDVATQSCAPRAARSITLYDLIAGGLGLGIGATYLLLRRRRRRRASPMPAYSEAG